MNRIARTASSFAFALSLVAFSTSIFAQTPDENDTSIVAQADSSPSPSPASSFEASALSTFSSGWKVGSTYEGMWHNTTTQQGSFSRLNVKALGDKDALVSYQLGDDGKATPRNYPADLTPNGVITWTQVVQGTTYRLSFSLTETGVHGTLEAEGKLLSEVDMEKKG